MKPFNLEEYLKNPDQRVVTREGRDARIICTDRQGERENDRVIIALVKDGGKGEYSFSYYSDGKYNLKRDSYLDLFFAPDPALKHEGWVNVYHFADSYYGIYNTKHEAEEAAKGDKDYIATTKIKWEE